MTKPNPDMDVSSSQLIAKQLFYLFTPASVNSFFETVSVTNENESNTTTSTSPTTPTTNTPPNTNTSSKQPRRSFLYFFGLKSSSNLRENTGGGENYAVNIDKLAQICEVLFTHPFTDACVRAHARTHARARFLSGTSRYI